MAATPKWRGGGAGSSTKSKTRTPDIDSFCDELKGVLKSCALVPVSNLLIPIFLDVSMNDIMSVEAALHWRALGKFN